MPENIVSVVLVTNAGQGFGRAIALAYGLADFDVVCADRDVGLASKTAAEIEERGGQAIPVQADVSSHIDVQKVFERVYDIFGDLSGVVHVAGFNNMHSFERLTEGELAELWSENLKSSFLMLRQSQRFLSEGWFVLVSPPFTQEGLHIDAMRGALGNLILGAEKTYRHINSNMVIPSRIASDPYHDRALVESVTFLGDAMHGISGQRLYVDLPPPPRVTEALLPEIQAALDISVRQDEIEGVLEEEELESSHNLYTNDASDDAIDFNDLKAGHRVTFSDTEGTYALNDINSDINDDVDDALLDDISQANNSYDDMYYDDDNPDYDDDDFGDDVDDAEDDDDYAIPFMMTEHQLRFDTPDDIGYLQEKLAAETDFEPLALDNIEAQLEAALANDPANDWYTHKQKENQQNSTPASRAGRNRDN